MEGVRVSNITIGGNNLKVKISIKGIGKTFEAQNGVGKSQTVLENINLDIFEGEFCSLIGASGCGKSTLLNIVAGLITPSDGNIYVDGEEVRGIHPKFGYMFQKDTLLPWLTILDNVMLPLEIQKNAKQEIALHYLNMVGLQGFQNHFPKELSGGMRKRVQLARLLAQNPEILLMDEPFGALDAQTKLVIQEEFLRIWEKERKTVIFVTHDLQEAITLSDRIVLLSANPGRVQTITPVDLARPRMLENAMNNAKFNQLFMDIWSGLKEEVRKSLQIVI
jgi:NitT/TauT family transport system ATP-binding protein